jgi:predicted MarR family transcription regulator
MTRKCRIICLDDGHVYESLTDAAESTGIPRTNIHQALEHNWKTHGVRFARLDGSQVYTRWQIKCLENGVIYRGLTEASNGTGVSINGIWNAIQRKGQKCTCCGLHFEAVNEEDFACI